VSPWRQPRSSPRTGPAGQLQAEDTLEGGDLEDVLDRGYSPNDRPQGVTAHGTTAYEESIDETIDERILQEEPDPNSAYGAPDNESGLDDERVGGDDPDSIDAAGRQRGR
jgi:hypothetical protein